MTVDEAVEPAAAAQHWDARISVIRLVPERFGTALHQEVYAAIAKRVYVPSLAPDFAYVHWREDYELYPFESAYASAFAILAGFGWTRTSDALGPVVRDTDGRVFTIPTLQAMLSVQPFPGLAGTQF